MALRIWSACWARLNWPHLVAKAGPQLVDGVELAGQLRELVVGLGQFAFLDRPDGGGDLRLLPGVFAGRELRGELPGFVDGRADQRVVETFDEPAGADLVGHPFGGGVRHIFAVHGWPTGRS